MNFREYVKEKYNLTTAEYEAYKIMALKSCFIQDENLAECMLNYQDAFNRVACKMKGIAYTILKRNNVISWWIQ